MLNFPIGHDIFASVIDNNLDFIDKTLFIKDVINDAASVLLITRPRRFGKTLNLSMLHHFLAAEAFGRKTADLFPKFKICDVDGGKYRQYQGKFPVIFLTFKSVKDHSFGNAYANILELIRGIYSEHQYLMSSDKLSAEDKEMFRAILRGKVDDAKNTQALLILCKYLYQHFNAKAWILIDEYDTPIQHAYTEGYYEAMVNVMRNMFGSALKTNPYLHKAVITGILRVAKESLFSDLNNLKVYSIFEDKYSQYFGFTEDEVNYILQSNNLNHLSSEIKRWYNGYQFGNTTIYNPWSIINSVTENGRLMPYWVNTGSTNLIREIIIKSKNGVKEKLEELLQEKTIHFTLDPYVVFGDLHNNESAIFSLLLAAGYLKPTNTTLTQDGLYECDLALPNFEVFTVFKNMIE